MQSQPPPPPPASVAAEPLIVTAARLPPSPADAAFSIITLPRAELQDQPRLAEALESLPGVSLFRRTSSAAANPTTQGLSLRSIAPSGAGRALVTLDGVPQNDPFGGWVIWSQLPPEAIEDAQVVRGAGAGAYGAGALTGVVALDELSRPGAASLDGYVGGLDSRRAAGATAQAMGGGEIFLSGSAEHTGGWIPVRERRGPADDRLSLDDWSLAGRFQGPVGRALLAVRLGAYQEQRQSGLVGAQSEAQGEDVSVTLAAAPDVGQPGYRLQAWARASDLHNRSVAVAADRSATTPANNQYATPAVGWGFNSALRGANGSGLTWEVGADVRGTDGEERELFRNLGAGFTRNREAGGRTLVGGGYAELSRQSGPWLLAGGVRLDGWSTTAGHRQELDLASGLLTIDEHPGDRSGAVPTARLGLRRDLGGGLYARAATYSGFRAPTLNELYRPFRVGNDITEANAALKPERLYGAEAALGGDEGGWSWSIEGFANRLQDPVTNVTIGSGPAGFPDFPEAGFIPAGGTLRQRQNAGRIDALGVEAEVSRRWGERTRVRFAADYTHAQVNGGDVAPQLTELQPAQAPRWTVTAGADWRPLARLGLSADARFESLRYEDDQNSRRLAAALVVDLRADWRLTSTVSGYVAADNLFDADVQTGVTADGVVSYDQPRVLRVGLSFRN